MRKWSRILPVLVLVAVLGGLAWLLLRPREPEPLYQGKPLSYWLQGFSPNYPIPTNGPAEPTYQDAAVAVQQIGTNAIPTLLRLLRKPDRPLTDRLFMMLRRQPFFRYRFTQPAFPTQSAWQGFMALGSNASPAVPQLLEIYNQRPNLVAQQVVCSILAQIGPPAKFAVPLLLRATTNTDAYVRNNSVYALGQIRGEPALIVPALIKSLEDPADYTRANAANALAAFGANARPAIPALLNLLAREQTNSFVVPNTRGRPANFNTIWGPNPTTARPFGGGNINVIGPATDALKAIDPQAATQAGIK